MISFDKKSEILGSLWFLYKENARHDEVWREFFQWADIALPFAYLVWEEIALPAPQAHHYIEEAWIVFCQIIKIDPLGDYNDLNDCFNASPNQQPTQEEDHGEIKWY